MCNSQGLQKRARPSGPAAEGVLVYLRRGHIQRDGERVILTPRSTSWRGYFAKAKRFSDDYPDHIEDAPPQQRRKS
jgi:hypothetical protein